MEHINQKSDVTTFYAIRRRHTPELVRVMMTGQGGEARLTMAPNHPVYRAKDLMGLAEVLNEPIQDWMSSSERPFLGSLERDFLEAVKVTQTEAHFEEVPPCNGQDKLAASPVLVKSLETRIESVEHLLPDARPLKELTSARRIPVKVAVRYVKDCHPVPVLPTEDSVDFRIVALPQDTTLEQAMEAWPGQQRYFSWEKVEVVAVAPVPEDYIDLGAATTASALILTK